MSTRCDGDLLQQITAEGDLLRRIATASRSLLHSVPNATPSKSLPPLSPSGAHGSAMAILLPAPRSPMYDLLTVGLDFGTAWRLSDKFLEVATELKAAFESQYRDICRLHLGDDLDRLDFPRLRVLLKSAHTAKYTRLLQCWLDEIVSRFGSRVLQARQVEKHDNDCPTPKLQRGGHQFTQRKLFFSQPGKQDPVAKNGTDRSSFLNRRTRSGKDGIEGGSGSSVPLPADLEKSLWAILSAEECDVKSAKLKQPYSDALELPPPSAGNTKFPLKAPPHAYPALYPPICSYDPFPIAECNGRFASPWIRKPTTRHNNSSSVGMTQLADMFAKMTLIGEVQNHCRHDMYVGVPRIRERNRQPEPSADVVLSSTLPPSPSPVLLPTTVVSSASPTYVTRGFQASQEAIPDFSTWTAHDLTVLQSTLPKSHQPIVARPGRKTAGLPTRLPASTSTDRRHVSPALSDVYSSSAASSMSLSPLSIPITISSDHDPRDSLQPQLFSSASVYSVSSGMIGSVRQEAPSDTSFSQTPDIVQFSYTPYSRTSSRSSSLTSVSSGSSSPSSSETESPPSTPPPPPTPLPPPKVWSSASISDPYLDLGFLDSLSPIDSLRSDMLFDDTVEQTEMQKQWSSSTISLSSFTDIGSS